MYLNLLWLRPTGWFMTPNLLGIWGFLKQKNFYHVNFGGLVTRKISKVTQPHAWSVHAIGHHQLLLWGCFSPYLKRNYTPWRPPFLIGRPLGPSDIWRHQMRHVKWACVYSKDVWLYWGRQWLICKQRREGICFNVYVSKGYTSLHSVLSYHELNCWLDSWWIADIWCCSGNRLNCKLGRGAQSLHLLADLIKQGLRFWQI